MITLKIINDENSLFKKIRHTDYSLQEMADIFYFYLKIGYKVYVEDGIEEILKINNHDRKKKLKWAKN